MEKSFNESTFLNSKRLLDDARKIIDSARSNAVRSVDFCRVQMYWNLGKRIFEEEQQGKERADYGAYVVKSLAEKLEVEYGSGFGKRQLEQSRQFFRMYPIANAVRSQLNWTQYRLLITKKIWKVPLFLISKTLCLKWERAFSLIQDKNVF